MYVYTVIMVYSLLGLQWDKCVSEPSTVSTSQVKETRDKANICLALVVNISKAISRNRA